MINRRSVALKRAKRRQALVDQGVLHGATSLFQDGDIIYSGVIVRLDAVPTLGMKYRGRHGRGY